MNPANFAAFADLDTVVKTVHELVAERAALAEQYRQLQREARNVADHIRDAEEATAALVKYLQARGIRTDDVALQSEGDGTEEEPLPERSQRILAVLADGPRDWPLNAILDAMEQRQWLDGLKNAREAIRIALDRMTHTGHVVRVQPATYALRRRLADTTATTLFTSGSMPFSGQPTTSGGASP